MPRYLLFPVPDPLRTLLWTVIPILFLFTINWSIDIYTSYRDSHQLTERIAVLQSLPQPPPAHTVTVQPLPDSTIEIEVLAIKLKMVNESGWTALFKILLLWSFLLINLLIYKLLKLKLLND
jgi:hypothetical protein